MNRGGRDLAAHWETAHHPPLSARKTYLSNIDLFILLDLLGSAAPQIPSYFPTTHWAYKAFATVEAQLRAAGLFASHKQHPTLWFAEADKDKGAHDHVAMWSGGSVLDDHMPFLARGVEVLHLIPSPFPVVWHDISDDAAHLHMDTVKDWALLTTAWLVGALGLEHSLGEARRGEAEGTVKTEL